MNHNQCNIKFRNPKFSTIILEKNQLLSEYLTIQNSPVLFGCRTGICGTCVVRVKGNISPPSDDEKEVLAVIADGDMEARLACQIDLTNDIEIDIFEL
ncbi:2Fe-2S iron-sulfur cluster binding domain-containing protein [Brunnivagina elsteri]|uniref:Ferredoxin n=1 Tax=Brunnivagina elsteri CCALA 953 TaxID=987040 RepID=A0A2A2TB36_9CYAN|nr:2Fe-2S iron-sulfur cluster-binding protein [Calothrix elsteri]PAX49840.1 ferredoxin [Calothrix elsteri CCALA 953]